MALTHGSNITAEKIINADANRQDTDISVISNRYCCSGDSFHYKLNVLHSHMAVTYAVILGNTNHRLGQEVKVFFL